jgi:hypothetical protein
VLLRLPSCPPLCLCLLPPFLLLTDSLVACVRCSAVSCNLATNQFSLENLPDPKVKKTGNSSRVLSSMLSFFARAPKVPCCLDSF